MLIYIYIYESSTLYIYIYAYFFVSIFQHIFMLIIDSLKITTSPITWDVRIFRIPEFLAINKFQFII